MVECLYCHDMVEILQASRLQDFNELACPQGTMGRTRNGALQQPCQGTGTPGGGFNHNVAGFLTKMAVESEKNRAVLAFLPPQISIWTHCHFMPHWRTRCQVMGETVSKRGG